MINFAIEPKEVYAEIIESVKKDIPTAIKTALALSARAYPDAVWQLAEYLHQANFCNEAYKLYQKIQEPKHYAAAQKAMSEIIQKMLIAYEYQPANMQLSKAEIHEYREELLRQSAAAIDAPLTSKIFFELAGFTMNPGHPEIKGDPESLVELSRIMATLNQRIATLENQLAALSNQRLFQQKDGKQPRENDYNESLRPASR